MMSFLCPRKGVVVLIGLLVIANVRAQKPAIIKDWNIDQVDSVAQADSLHSSYNLITSTQMIQGPQHWEYWKKDSYAAPFIFKKDSNGNWLPWQFPSQSFRPVVVRSESASGYMGLANGNSMPMTALLLDMEKVELSAPGKFLDYDNRRSKPRDLLAGALNRYVHIKPKPVDISGKTMIIGFQQDGHNQVDNKGVKEFKASGSAHIFEQDSLGRWIHQQELVASDRKKNELFGRAVAISGEYALIGAYKEDNAPSIYVYHREVDGIWRETQRLQVPSWCSYGGSVSIAGNYAMIGGWKGNAVIYELDTLGVWQYKQGIWTDRKEGFYTMQEKVSISEHYAVLWVHYSPIPPEKEKKRFRWFAQQPPNRLEPEASDDKAEMMWKQDKSKIITAVPYEPDPAPLETTIKTFPNPTKDWLTVQMEHAIDGKLEVLNMEGKVVMARKLTGERVVDLSLKKLPKGLYVVKVSAGEYMPQTKMVIHY